MARLTLLRTPTIGPISFAQLIGRFGSAAAALDALPGLVRRGGGRVPAIADRRVIEAEMTGVAALGARYLFRGEPGYPPLLDQIESAPPALIVKGDPALLEGRAVAMVGARNASANAMRFARGLAAELGRAGAVVVSGLARGIDTEAHVGALDTGTIAVIAGGIDVVYPPENARLQAEVAERGLVVSEQPPGLEPRARHFPYRNRIIAGITPGTVVVEAAPKSGSLITARYAAEYGREVMAVPGSPIEPRARGCNLLIREGATLVQDADEVLEALGPIDARMLAPPAPRFAPAPTSEEPSDGDRRDLIGLLGPVAIPVDELVRLSGGSPASVQMVLLELELAGRLERHAGGRVALVG